MRDFYMLISAIILEIFGTAITKYMLVNKIPGSLFVMPVVLICSYYFLSKALRTIPLSIAYAAWEGIGLIGTTIIACSIFGETMTLLKFIAFSLIIFGLLLLKQGTKLKDGVVNG